VRSFRENSDTRHGGGGRGGILAGSVVDHTASQGSLTGGSVQGYRVLGRFLARIPGSHRALGLDPDATPQFTTIPGQVAFTPDGAQLVVTTKGNGNDIDVFGVGFGGRLSAKPTVNAEPGTVPFAIAFDPFGHLVIAEAGTNAVSAAGGRFLYVQTGGNGIVDEFSVAANGALTKIGAVTVPGAVGGEGIVAS
jgi:DNA-binding beta-propeller fold protein YncE